MSDILIYDKIEKTMTKEGRCYGEDTVFTDLTEAMKDIIHIDSLLVINKRKKRKPCLDLRFRYATWLFYHSDLENARISF